MKFMQNAVLRVVLRIRGFLRERREEERQSRESERERERALSRVSRKCNSSLPHFLCGNCADHFVADKARIVAGGSTKKGAWHVALAELTINASSRVCVCAWLKYLQFIYKSV